MQTRKGPKKESVSDWWRRQALGGTYKARAAGEGEGEGADEAVEALDEEPGAGADPWGEDEDAKVAQVQDEDAKVAQVQDEDAMDAAGLGDRFREQQELRPRLKPAQGRQELQGVSG